MTLGNCTSCLRTHACVVMSFCLSVPLVLHNLCKLPFAPEPTQTCGSKRKAGTFACWKLSMCMCRRKTMLTSVIGIEMCAVCCVLCTVCCVLCAVCCVLCAVCCVLCCVLCAVCRVLCGACCVLRVECCGRCAVCSVQCTGTSTIVL